MAAGVYWWGRLVARNTTLTRITHNGTVTIQHMKIKADLTTLTTAKIAAHLKEPQKKVLHKPASTWTSCDEKEKKQILNHKLGTYTTQLTILSTSLGHQALTRQDTTHLAEQAQPNKPTTTQTCRTPSCSNPTKHFPKGQHTHLEFNP